MPSVNWPDERAKPRDDEGFEVVLPRPRPLGAAVALMVVGAIVNAVADLVVGSSELRGGPFGNNQAPAIAMLLVLAIHVALWAWMAVKNSAGRTWARILATVFFGIQLANTLLTAAAVSQAYDRPIARLGFCVALSVIGLIVVVLIFAPGCRAYYEANSRQAYRTGIGRD